MEIKEKQNAKDWASCYIGKNVMYEGIATYQNEAVYLSQDTLKKNMPELKGRPVIIEHKLGITPDNMQEHAVGYVTKSEYNNETGGFDCEFVVWDDEAKKLLKNGYTLSTSYVAKEFANGGTFINTPYDREITGLGFTHLAIVKNPRYEKVEVFQNEKEDDTEMQNDLGGLGMDKIEVEQSFLQSLLENVAKSVPFMNSKEKEEDKKEEKKVDDDAIEIDGETYSKKELVNAYKSCKQNAEDEADKKKVEKDDAKEAIEDEEDGEKEEKTNSVEDEIDWYEKMQELMNSSEAGEDDKITPVDTREKQLELGKKIFG